MCILWIRWTLKNQIVCSEWCSQTMFHWSLHQHQFQQLCKHQSHSFQCWFVIWCDLHCRHDKSCSTPHATSGTGWSTAKLVSQIILERFVDLSEVVPTNLQHKDPEPQLLLHSHLVLTSQPEKQQWQIKDIASWLEAFAIFIPILVLHVRSYSVPALNPPLLSPFSGLVCGWRRYKRFVSMPRLQG